MSSDDVERAARCAAERAVKSVLEKYATPSGEYLNTKQAAVYLNLSAEYLEIARHKADGSSPPYTKLPRAVRYKRGDLDAWMARQRVQAA